ncbi:MAG: hypothetical protein PVG99_01285 [Desulfobacteraceae bacterium]|jgi:hypothetical protein
MEGTREKFTISITESGLKIRDEDGKCLSFTAGEALMLLDILREEEPKLKEIADAASPIPMRIKF